jgi:hypothetical protein
MKTGSDVRCNCIGTILGTPAGAFQQTTRAIVAMLPPHVGVTLAAGHSGFSEFGGRQGLWIPCGERADLPGLGAHRNSRNGLRLSGGKVRLVFGDCHTIVFGPYLIVVQPKIWQVSWVGADRSGQL